MNVRLWVLTKLKRWQIHVSILLVFSWNLQQCIMGTCSRATFYFLNVATSFYFEGCSCCNSVWFDSTFYMLNGKSPLCIQSPLLCSVCSETTPPRWPCTTHTYLAGETPWSWRWFTQGEAQPLHSGCADPCEFLKCGNLDCIICGSGGLRSRSPLINCEMTMMRTWQ